ncbi:hypothetical protein EDD96_0238 [Streptomyces sp. Ag109_G2-6]|uniref:hypothetical protein n=1 Tax=Streptomyces TaxID=1883 RepID=UPI0009A49B33|nr:MULTISPECIES: hypothetical protein [Streptomyces]RPF43729.1 hypothetical protein EDD96_0238 [Streptomyces sp. Ag109_G2-6]
MHLLEDHHPGLSPLARKLLERTGRRQEPAGPRTPTELLTVPDRTGTGRRVPAPLELVTAREGFAQRLGGLRYTVRRSTPGVPGEQRESASEWNWDLGTAVWPDPAGGWYFEWTGELVSSPVRYLAHTDGRVGVEAGDGVFREIASSTTHLIESHAVMDAVAGWDPWPIEADGHAVAGRLDGLTEVAEASGPMLGWRMSDVVAVMEFREWSNQVPRAPRAFMWSRGEEGRRRLHDATRAARPGGRDC